MKKHTAILLLAVLLVTAPLMLLGLWIYAGSQTPTYQQTQDLYRSWLPAFLRVPFAVAKGSVACCVLAAVCSGLVKRNVVGWKRGIAKLILAVSIIAGAFYVWSMM